MNLLTRYTWKAKYMLPYESNWGRREKFCILNGYSYNLYKKNKINLENYNYEESITILDQINSSVFENTYIRFCPQCMAYGYHSSFHQNLLFMNCFIHMNESLIETNMPYVMSPVGEPKNTNSIINVCKIIQNESLLKEINAQLKNIDDSIRRIKILDYNIRSFNNKIIPYNSTRMQLQNIIFNSNKQDLNAKLICILEKSKLKIKWKELMSITIKRIYSFLVQENDIFDDNITLKDFKLNNFDIKCICQAKLEPKCI